MSQYNVRATDPGFKEAFKSFTTEHRDACIYFLKHGSSSQLKDVDYSSDMIGWLDTKRQNLHSNLNTEFNKIYESFDFKSETQKNDKLIEFSNSRIDMLDKAGQTVQHIASYCEPLVKSEPSPITKKLSDSVAEMQGRIADDVMSNSKKVSPK